MKLLGILLGALLLMGGARVTFADPQAADPPQQQSATYDPWAVVLRPAYDQTNAGDFAAAHATLDKIKPQANTPHEKICFQICLGYTYSKENDLTNAEIAYKDALDLTGTENKDVCNAWMGLGNARLSARQTGKAREAYQAILSIRDLSGPFRCVARSRIGQTYIFEHDYASAAACFHDAAKEPGISLNSQSVLLSRAGRTYIQARQYDKALAEFSAAAEVPETAGDDLGFAYNGMGDAYFCLKNLPSAREAYMKTVNLAGVKDMTRDYAAKQVKMIDRGTPAPP